MDVELRKLGNDSGSENLEELGLRLGQRFHAAIIPNRKITPGFTRRDFRVFRMAEK